jgi:hypothetical protein
MASTTLLGLRAEIDAALAIVTPQIRGLEDLTKVSLSQPALDEVSGELADRRRRKALLDAVIAALDAVDKAMDALVADGYPAIPKEEVSASVYAELQEQQADILAAIAEFEKQPLAENIAVVLGDPADKPVT